MNRFLFASASLLVSISPAFATPSATPKLVEPHLHVARSGAAAPRIALTFDACMGKADDRILSVLVEQKVPATIFVTARWLKHNPQATAILLAHPDLFELENHGLNHIPAVDRPATIYGIAAAGSPQAVRHEVQGGVDAMVADHIPAPHWFRGATAKYSLSAIGEIKAMGYRIAGYSVNGDGGSLLGAAVTEKHFATARDGDVIISHINQPTHAAGEGVARGILDLKARGARFVRLQDAEDTGDDGTTGAMPPS